MNNLTKTLVAGSVLMTAAAFSNQASAVIVDGVDLGSGTITMQDISRESIVTTTGNTLYGVGHITAINNNISFAPGVELNFIYTATVAFDNGAIIVFSPGVSLQFFVDASGAYTNALAAGSPLAAQAAISGGGATDFLDFSSVTVPTLAPYNVSGAPTTGGYFGTGTDLAGSAPSGNGVGYFNVVAGGLGVANSYLATQAELFNGTTPYDFLFTSTFSVPGTNPVVLPIQDASTFTGSVSSVDEPDTLALLGLGLLATVLGARRRQSATLS